jgi:hypothetical protein
VNHTEAKKQAETAVVAYLRANGFPDAERLPNQARPAIGGLTLCPCCAAEVKTAREARRASRRRLLKWMGQTSHEQRRPDDPMGLLILERPGDPDPAHWTACLPWGPTALGEWIDPRPGEPGPPWVAMELRDAAHTIRHWGFGDSWDPPDGEEEPEDWP